MHTEPCASPFSPPTARPHTAASRSSDPKHRDGHTCLSGPQVLGNLRGREGRMEGGREILRGGGVEGGRGGGREG